MPPHLKNFYGNPEIAAALQEIIRGGRIPRTMLFSGLEALAKRHSRSGRTPKE
jgi:hypothetical protein